MQIVLLDKKCKPKYAHDTDACMDCFSRLDVEWEREGNIDVAYVPLGFKASVPRNHMLQVFSRSGYGFKQNISLANSVGIIDSGFRGEVMVKLIRIGVSLDSPKAIKAGDKVCQIALVERPRIYLDVVDKLSGSDRGANGFGSTGTWI